MDKKNVGKKVLIMILIICFFPVFLIYWALKGIFTSSSEDDGISMDEIIDNEELME